MTSPLPRRDGVVTELTLPTPDSRPVGITPAADGSVWFTERRVNRIGPYR